VKTEPGSALEKLTPWARSAVVAELAPHAVLVATGCPSEVAAAARQRLAAGGVAEITVLTEALAGTRRAAA
jgi:hypothetical protein